MNKKGFTLIELLIVLAIVVISSLHPISALLKRATVRKSAR